MTNLETHMAVYWENRVVNVDVDEAEAVYRAVQEADVLFWAVREAVNLAVRRAVDDAVREEIP